ncbi:MAG: adenosylcobalamin-dependent ribonucleoside-diphosphate reductase [Planctomycetota bacterium]
MKKIDFTDNAREVLRRRYLKRDACGKPVETPEDMFVRVAESVAQAEKQYGGAQAVAEAEGLFREVLFGLEFLPNSPALMNAGRRLGQLAACFVLPIGDSIESIFGTLKDAAYIHQSGGGTGFSFSRLRPAGDVVASSSGVSSGPVSFMRVFNAATEAINQGGFRRGANMAILRVDHPDILRFVEMKNNPNELRNFNISVALTGGFVEALGRNASYALVNPRTGETVRTVPAAEVYERTIDSAWRTGEPGIIFLDAINADNPTPALGEIESTNPCGEQPLLPYEACVLGSVNLSLCVKDGQLDEERLRRVSTAGVRFLDDCVDASRFPLPQITQIVHGNRKIGLGVMGFAELLIRLGVRYDSEEALGVAHQAMRVLASAARDESQRLAVERGPFPNFRESVYAERGNPPQRNATLTTVAPTGTLSIIAGTSSGIEPLFSVAFTRNVLDGRRLVEVNRLFLEIGRGRGFANEALLAKVARTGTVAQDGDVPEDVRALFRTSHDIPPPWHVRIQGAFQEHVDNAVSKTVNLAASATRDDVREVFDLARKLGCKGVTIYRDQSRSEQVLERGAQTWKEGKRIPSTIGGCPQCGADVVAMEGCSACRSCGYSRCGGVV